MVGAGVVPGSRGEVNGSEDGLVTAGAAKLGSAGAAVAALAGGGCAGDAAEGDFTADFAAAGAAGGAAPAAALDRLGGGGIATPPDAPFAAGAAFWALFASRSS